MLKYVKTDSGYAVIECDKNAESVEIPSTYKGQPVTAINHYAFYGCANLKRVTIPNSVTSIGDCAFDNCINLTSITIPDSVTTIGKYAFLDCISLQNITIPNDITSIGDCAFGYCKNLTSIMIPKSIGNYAFYGCTNLTSIMIPNGVTSIGDYAFSGCSSFTSITIPSSVTSIGYCAFCVCDNLTSITVEKNNQKYHSAGNCIIETSTKTLVAGCKESVIPNDGSVTSIGSCAFGSCRNLTSITIPDSVTSIGEGAFVDCQMLVSKLHIYKAFNIKKNNTFMCRNMIYQLDKWNECSGELELCKNGLHYCTNLFEIFNYYSGKLDEDIAICLCETDGKVLTSDTSKCCARRLKPIKRLTRQEIIAILNGK